MGSCEGFWFVLLGDGVLVSIVHFLIFLGICDVYIGLTLQGVLQAFVFGFPLSGEIPRFACILSIKSFAAMSRSKTHELCS